MLELFDLNLWLVLLALVLGFLAVAFLYPQLSPSQADMSDKNAKVMHVVYVYANSVAEAFAEIEKEYKQAGWQIVSWEYDTRKKVYIFVLER